MFETILSIISGLVVCIPVVIKLVQSIINNTKMKNWNILVGYLAAYMAEAENLFTEGADKKKWVMDMIEQSADLINYEIDEIERAKISRMIDDLCALSKEINNK